MRAPNTEGRLLRAGGEVDDSRIQIRRRLSLTPLPSGDGIWGNLQQRSKTGLRESDLLSEIVKAKQ